MNAPLRRPPLVVERLPSRSAPGVPVALPEPALLAIAAIVRDMRDVPRDCLRDPAELLHWLRRMANRVEGVAAIRVPMPPRSARRPSAPAGAPARALTARQTAEAVFAGPSKACATKGLKDETLRSASTPRDRAEAVFATAPKTPAAPVERRTIVSRKGRAVPVEIRRARQHGQMELGL